MSVPGLGQIFFCFWSLSWCNFFLFFVLVLFLISVFGFGLFGFGCCAFGFVLFWFSFSSVPVLVPVPEYKSQLIFHGL